MILTKLVNGWPDRVVSWEHSGSVPNGHLVFESLDELDSWKQSHSDLFPSEPEVSEPVPEEVPLWAFRAVLTIQGITPQVEALINGLPEPQKTVANVQWVYGNYIIRTHPLIVALGSQLGMTEAQIDDVFRTAATLT